MSTARTVLLARTVDGLHVSYSATGIIERNGSLEFIEAPSPLSFGEIAIALWQRWADRIPQALYRLLVAEAGEVSDGGKSCLYQIARIGSLILPHDDDAIHFGPARPWIEIPGHLPLILGPSAVLALVDFALNGIEGLHRQEAWPFEDRFSLFDTDASPYPPQGLPPPHRDFPLTAGGPPFRKLPDYLSFAVKCRNDSWQRPIDALHHVSRRNLRVAYVGSLAQPSVPHLILDGLMAEVEPCLGQASFLTQATYCHGDGRMSLCSSPLIARCHVGGLLCAIAGLGGSVAAACVCDPIDGDIYGYAPPLALLCEAPIELEDLLA